MTTDLGTTNDHVCSVLARQVENARLNDDPERERALADAISRLRNYETLCGVTFATLDNEALQAVREDYAAIYDSETPDRSDEALERLAVSVRDLLGLA